MRKRFPTAQSEYRTAVRESSDSGHRATCHPSHTEAHCRGNCPLSRAARRTLLHLDGSREEHVVFDVNVLLQLHREVGEISIERTESRTCFLRGHEIPGALPKSVDRCQVISVVVTNGLERKLDGSKERDDNLGIWDTVFETGDVREEIALFPGHVRNQVAREFLDLITDLPDFRQASGMRGAQRSHRLDERDEAFSRTPVMMSHDFGRQL